MDAQKKRRKTILKTYGIILAVGFGYFLWGELTGLYLPCFTHSLTGLQCPGCGISRMFLALAEFDIPLAFSHNPVVFVLLILWNLIAVACFAGKPAFIHRRKFLLGCLYASVAVLVIFGIVRNFP